MARGTRALVLPSCLKGICAQPVMTPGSVPPLNPYLALSQPACSAINLSWARNSALPTPYTACSLLPTRVHESHPNIYQYPQEKGPLFVPTAKTSASQAHVQQVQARTGSSSGGLGRVGLGKDPRQQQLPPAKLPPGLGGRVTNWEVSGKFPLGGRWSQIGFCAALLRVAGPRGSRAARS